MWSTRGHAVAETARWHQRPELFAMQRRLAVPSLPCSADPPRSPALSFLSSQVQVGRGRAQARVGRAQQEGADAVLRQPGLVP
jgi:hypothetical protein